MSTDDRIPVGALRAFAATVFEAAGSSSQEAQLVGDHLVDANLAGHDSHGVIRISKYVDWHARGLVLANQHVTLVKDSGCHAVVDGNFGYGQVIGRETMDIAIYKARDAGVCAVAIRNSGHLGRIGAWAEQTAQAGLASIHFVNTSGFGTSPFAGRKAQSNTGRCSSLSPGAPSMVSLSLMWSMTFFTSSSV